MRSGHRAGHTGGDQLVCASHFPISPYPQVPAATKAEFLLDLEKGLMGQGRSQTYQQINQLTDVNIARNGTK